MNKITWAQELLSDVDSIPITTNEVDIKSNVNNFESDYKDTQYKNKGPIFKEDEFLINYGVGYSGINDLVYGLSIGKVSALKTSSYLNAGFIQVGGNFFWRSFFDLGFSTFFGISEKFVSATDKNTRLSLFALKLHFLIHYPFETIDIYGGVSTGIFVSVNMGINTDVGLGWSALFGVRFRIYKDYGMYVEAAFPLPWISFGGYVKLF